MNYLDVLFHPTLIMATILFTIMSISFEIAYQQFLNKIAAVSGSYWIAKNIGTPFFPYTVINRFYLYELSRSLWSGKS